jgi:hypothetical protein
MSVKSAVGMIAAAILLAACSPEPPLYFGPKVSWLGTGLSSNVEAINSTAYAVRPPPPGQPGYLETIRFINDGVKYVDPYSEFFISYNGQMCFRGLVNHHQAEFEHYQNYWCIPPTAVNNVDAIENDVSYVNEVRLWCRHAAPQCARQYGYPNFLEESPPYGNSISAQTVPFLGQRDAISYLVYLMGGNVASAEPLAGPTLPVPLTPRVGSSPSEIFAPRAGSG